MRFMSVVFRSPGIYSRSPRLAGPVDYWPATLQVPGLDRSMEVIALMMEQQFLASEQNDFMARLASGELHTEATKQKLLDAYAEELSRK